MKINHLYSLYLQSSGVCTDTRKIRQNDFFIALKGENFNGNSFAEKAIQNGAIAAVVDEKEYENIDKNIFWVEDGLIFLHQLAHHHRNQFDIPIVALTGSNGKTTTKELIATCLEEKYQVCYTKGNLNNHIGVPLTLLSIRHKDDIAVIEMGANHQKEIELLCQIAAPDFGYITNFGKAHLEGFGGFEGVIKGKSEMYDYLKSNNKKAFVLIDDTIQKEKSIGLDIISFGFENQADYQFKRKTNHQMAGIQYQNTSIISHLSGFYNENNIAAAVTIALHFGVEIDAIQNAITNYFPKNHRSQQIEQSGYHILLDAYNANPSSMEVALKNFSQKTGSKAVILGDMFELGDSSQQEHQNLADLCNSYGFDEIYLIGEHFYKTDTATNVEKYKTREEFIFKLENHIIQSKNILIKGSRGMALEKILEFI